MDKVYTKSEVARMLKTDVTTIKRLQKCGLLDQVDSSSLTGGISESSVRAYLAGKLPTMDRMLRSGTPRGR